MPCLLDERRTHVRSHITAVSENDQAKSSCAVGHEPIRVVLKDVHSKMYVFTNPFSTILSRVPVL